MPGLLPILIGACATVGFILIFVASGRRRHLWRAIGSLLLSLPLGVITYMFVGIRLARTHNLSRFYSWPFGGANIGHDGPLVASTLVFVAAWFLLLFGVSSLVSKSPAADPRK
jgi:energy-coupling factor transporter transmembrane protein EcfT